MAQTATIVSLKKKVLGVAATGLLILGSALAYRTLAANRAAFIAPDDITRHLRAVSAEEKFGFSLQPLYLQTDPRWSDDRIGGSHETLGRVGCVICSLSMALSHYGVKLEPPELNRLLKEREAFTGQGWLRWQAVSAVAPNILIEIPARPTLKNIDQALAKNRPVLAKLFIAENVPHWVLIVGRAPGDYLIKDPLGSGLGLEKLSKYRSGIYAIRIVRKKNS